MAWIYKQGLSKVHGLDLVHGLKWGVSKVTLRQFTQITVYAIYFASLIFRESGLQHIFASS